MIKLIQISLTKVGFKIQKFKFDTYFNVQRPVLEKLLLFFEFKQNFWSNNTYRIFLQQSLDEIVRDVFYLTSPTEKLSNLKVL